MLTSIIVGFLLLLVVLIAVFLVIVAMQPEDFRIERSATISASPQAVFAHVNNFKKWEAWSPWIQMDPNATNTYEGPAEGTGSVFKWSGNKQVGQGAMTILESRPSEFVKIKLDFIKPMEATSTTEISLRPNANQTEVNWNMYGKNSFIAKAFCLFMNMDKVVGGKFEEGLAKLKSVVESSKN